MEGPQLSKEHLTTKTDIAFSCLVCNRPLDLEESCECLECEVAICAADHETLSQKDQFCCPNPQCQSSDGFKKKLSRTHKQKIAEL